MDIFFLAHGSPNLVIGECPELRSFLQSWKQEIMQEITPKAILVVSAHWDTDEPSVNLVHGVNDTIHDFVGFAKEVYEFEYPAPGAPKLAKRVKELLDKAGFGPVKEIENRGLDEGSWPPLFFMYPEGDVPVCQLSVQSEKSALQHYDMGKALAPLRDEGVLIIGSGSCARGPSGPLNPPVEQSATEFDVWLKEALVDGRHEDVINYEKKGPKAQMVHPTTDHILPLHVVLGAAGQDAQAELIHHSWSLVEGTNSFASYRFTTPN